MASNYQPTIPTGQVNLDQDYLNVQNNFQQLDTTFGVDHTLVSNTTAQNGYHKDIHFIPQATPSTVTGYGQLFTKTVNDGINSDQSLFYLSGGGFLTQLTRNIQPLASASGYTFLPGGLILQWGTQPLTVFGTPFNSSGPVNFNINFPANVFALWGQPISSSLVTSTSATVSLFLQGTDLTKFGYGLSTNQTKVSGFTWFALGN